MEEVDTICDKCLMEEILEELIIDVFGDGSSSAGGR